MNKLTACLGYVPKRIAVFRAIKLGDLLCAVPAFRALRQAFPEAHIALISLPWAQEFVDRYSVYFDEFIAFPGWPGLPEQPLDPARTVAFLSQMQQRHWDVVLQMQGNGTLVNAMLTLFGAKAMAGYYPAGHPEQLIGDQQLLMPYPVKEHEVKRHMQLMGFLGLPQQDDTLAFPITADDQTRAKALLKRYGLTPGGYVCLHAGGISGRRWPEAQFARVADALAERGYTILLTGTDAETAIVETVQRLMRQASISLTGQTDLGMLAAVLDQSALLVSNDTGVSHLAAACHVPSVVIFTSADPAEWAPLDRERHRVVREKDATNVESVIDEAFSLLRTTQRAKPGLGGR